MIITTRRREVRALFRAARHALEAECERIDGMQRAAAAWLALMYVLERRAVDNDWSGVDAMIRNCWDWHETQRMAWDMVPAELA